MASRDHPLQAVKVFGERGAAPGEVVLLEEQIQEGVEFVKPAPEEAVTPRVRLRQDLDHKRQTRLKIWSIVGQNLGQERSFLHLGNQFQIGS